MRVVRAMQKWGADVLTLLREIRDHLAWLRGVLSELVVPQPGPLSVRSIAEENGKMKYEVFVPQLTAEEVAEVVSGELVKRVYTDNNGNETVIDLELNKTQAIEMPNVLAAKGSTFTLNITNTDDDGNVSSNPLTQTAVDNIPPSKPGQVALRTLSEEEPTPA